MNVTGKEFVSAAKLDEIIKESKAAVFRGKLRGITPYIDYGWRGVIIEEWSGERREYVAPHGERGGVKITELA